MTDTATLNRAAAAASWAAAAGFSGNDVRTAVGLAYAESSFNTVAQHRNTNGSTDYGEWQINSVHSGASDWSFGKSWSTNGWQQGSRNAQMAHWVYTRQGWNAWSTYGGSRYTAGLTIFDEAAGQGLTVSPYISPAGAAASSAFATGAAAATGGASAVATDIFSTFANAHLWQRVALVIVGGGLVLAGLAIISKPVVTPVVKGAGKVVGTAAKVIK